MRGYWQDLYDQKFNLLTDEEKVNFNRDFEIRLHISIDDIVLTGLSDSQPKQITTCNENCQEVTETVLIDCESTEFLTIAVLLWDLKEGEVRSNYFARGEWDRDHSEECPWIEP